MNINKLKIEISKIKFLNKPLRILYNKIFLKYFYNFLNNLKIKKFFTQLLANITFLYLLGKILFVMISKTIKFIEMRSMKLEKNI